MLNENDQAFPHNYHSGMSLLEYYVGQVFPFVVQQMGIYNPDVYKQTIRMAKELIKQL